MTTHGETTFKGYSCIPGGDASCRPGNSLRRCQSVQGRQARPRAFDPQAQQKFFEIAY